jgi:HSP20 family protein
MRLISYDPWNALARLQSDIERAFERPPGLGLSGRGAFPPVNVFGGKTGYVLRFEVPGLAPEDLSLEIQGRTLTVGGKRRIDEPSDGSIHRRETWRGEFSRSLQLPEDADLTNAAAECRNGVLVVRVPQREEARPRRISVQSKS